MLGSRHARAHVFVDFAVPDGAVTCFVVPGAIVAAESMIRGSNPCLRFRVYFSAAVATPVVVGG